MHMLCVQILIFVFHRAWCALTERKQDYPIWAKATAGVSVLNRQGDLGKQ